MKNSTFYTRHIMRCFLAATLLIPALGWAHGMVDIPVARQGYCNKIGGVWNPPPSDAGCAEVADLYPNAGEAAYPLSHWHQFVHNIKNYQDYPQAVQSQVTDGHLCSANDPNLRGYDLATANWHKTVVTPVNGQMDVRIQGTQPHVPSTIRIYLSKAGYNPATTPLKWSDLTQVHEETVTDYKRDWATPPYVGEPPSIGNFQFKVPVPEGQTGNAVLFVYWQRLDAGNEAFFNCSDITLDQSGTPAPWTEIGTFITQSDAPKVGDNVRARVFGHTNAFLEKVDVSADVTSPDATVWAAALESKLRPFSGIVKVGIRNDNGAILFDPSRIYGNRVFVSDAKDTYQFGIIDGGGETPIDQRPPLAVYTGPASVKSGEKFTVSASQSVGYNGALRYHWAGVFFQPSGIAETATASATAPVVTKPENMDISINVLDPKNGKNNAFKTKIAVTPSTGGGDDYPAYAPGTAYKAGDKVTNGGASYQCKEFPASGWCGQSPAHYEPGKGSHWSDAWDKLQ